MTVCMISNNVYMTSNKALYDKITVYMTSNNGLYAIK